MIWALYVIIMKVLYQMRMAITKPVFASGGYFATTWIECFGIKYMPRCVAGRL